MTNDELEAVRARAERARRKPFYNVLGTESCLLVHTDIPALLDEVAEWSQAASVEANQRREAEARATRAEAHAERLSELLTRALWEIRSQTCDGVIYDEPLEGDIAQALSAYRSETT